MTTKPTTSPTISPIFEELPLASGVVVVVVVVTILMVTSPEMVVWQVTVLPLSTVVTPLVVHEELVVS